MPNLTMSIPHQLTREEAKRRIQEQIRLGRQQFGGMVQRVEERWDVYALDLTVAAAGETVTAHALVEEHVVQVSVALPWMFALLANSVRRGIEEQGRKLLGPPPKA